MAQRGFISLADSDSQDRSNPSTEDLEEFEKPRKLLSVKQDVERSHPYEQPQLPIEQIEKKIKVQDQIVKEAEETNKEFYEVKYQKITITGDEMCGVPHDDLVAASKYLIEALKMREKYMKISQQKFAGTAARFLEQYQNHKEDISKIDLSQSAHVCKDCGTTIYHRHEKFHSKRDSFDELMPYVKGKAISDNALGPSHSLSPWTGYTPEQKNYIIHQVNGVFQIPLLNLAVSGIFSAIIALLFDLEKLVEFMSIGTLLAYTIVSASVIILRYKTTKPGQKEAHDDESVSASTPSMLTDNLHSSQAAKLKPKFWWVTYIIGESGHDDVISASVTVFIMCSIFICLHIHFSITDVFLSGWWAKFVLVFMILFALGCLLLIGAHKQNPSTNTFRVPWVPFIPGLSILCNIGLMIHLNVLTWVRFAVWMTIGLLVYFLYGIKHSKEGDQTSTYSMLITSSEAHKEPWGTMSPADNAMKGKTATDEPETPLLTKKQQKEDKRALKTDCDPEQ